MQEFASVYAVPVIVYAILGFASGLGVAVVLGIFRKGGGSS